MNLKRYWWVIIILILTPILVWICFIIQGFLPLGPELKRADWLAFSGALLGYIGTVILGGITVWQTVRADKEAKEAKQKTDELQNQLIELYKMQSMEYYPVFGIDTSHSKESVISYNDDSDLHNIIWGISSQNNRQCRFYYKEQSKLIDNNILIKLFFRLKYESKFQVNRIDFKSLVIYNELNHEIIKDVGATKLGTYNQYFDSGSNNRDYCDVIFNLFVDNDRITENSQLYFEIEFDSYLIIGKTFTQKIRMSIRNNKLSNYEVLCISPK